jgi:predicted kinase
MNDTARTINILRGLPGSGKSTYAEQYIAESPLTRTRINRDIIRHTYYGAYWGEAVDEPGVTAIEMQIARTIMKKGDRDIVVDNTNTKDIAVIAYLFLADEYGYTVEFIDFNVEVEELIRRDALRDRQATEAVIRMFAESYLDENSLLLPPPVLPF